MKLIVGLGNPGKEYDKTRHNIGFMVLDNYLGDVKWQSKYEALYYEENNDGEKIIYVKPQTYMNLSGESVKKFVNFYKIDINNILIIQDDLDLTIGKYRIKTNSSSGGHNGIKSIISCLNSDAFARLKIGISHDRMLDTKDYVLEKFRKNELQVIEELYPILNKILEAFKSEEITKIINDFNRK